tara:strand:+ start:735 stop:2123 length:1389 start_codon:yes stop_codon:yes gene_type:complete
MAEQVQKNRDIVFLSKATPGDDDFALWLAPRLEVAGYRVFADILNLDTGDKWRRKITSTLQDHAAKMLLCCSPETLGRDGVLEELGIAEELTKILPDPNFIFPLRLKEHRKVFGVGELQRIDFKSRWADALQELLEQLEKQGVPKASGGQIQPQWEQYKRRKQVVVENAPEPLTSNWLRIASVPNELFLLEPRGSFDHAALHKLARSFEYPAIPFMRGVLTFAQPIDLEEHFSSIGKFEIKHSFGFADFAENGSSSPQVFARDARRMAIELYRQAWEKHCAEKGFLAHNYSSGVTGFHVGDELSEIGSFTSWGTQGESRRSKLRNIKKGKVWEFGVSVIPSTFPYPHLRLKGRVLFSDMENKKKTLVIPEKDKQHSLRRSLCSGWRNKAWHGRLMAFMELLSGESPYVSMPVGGGQFIVADAMPIQFTSPVTTQLPDLEDESAEEVDHTTLGRFYPAENGDD